MRYEKQHFVKGQVLKADHLNHMEDGIAEAMDPAVGIPGAAGDGTTDDTAALTAALNQSNCVVDGGNKKYKYLVVDIIGVENLTVKDVVFWKGQQVNLKGCKNVRFEHCRWEGINCNDTDIPTYGVELTTRTLSDSSKVRCEEITFEGCTFKDIWYNEKFSVQNDHAHYTTGQGIRPAAVHKFFVRHCLFTQIKGNAAIHWNTWEPGSGYFEITDNLFYLTGWGGVCIFCMQSEFDRMVGKVSGNHFIGCGLGYIPDSYMNTLDSSIRGVGCAALLGGYVSTVTPYKPHAICENNVFEDNVESSIEGPAWNPIVGNYVVGQGALQDEANCTELKKKYHLDYDLKVRYNPSVNFVYRGQEVNADGATVFEEYDPMVITSNVFGKSYVDLDGFLMFTGDFGSPLVITNNVLEVEDKKSGHVYSHFLKCNFRKGLRIEGNKGIKPYFNGCTMHGELVLDDFLSQWDTDFSDCKLTVKGKKRFPEAWVTTYDPQQVLLENEQAKAENGMITLTAYDVPGSDTEDEATEPTAVYDIANDSRYDAEEGAVTFDGTDDTGIDTGVKLFADSSDFTVICKFRLDDYHDAKLKNFSFIPVLSAMNYTSGADYATKSPGFDVGLSMQEGDKLETVATGGFVMFRNSWRFRGAATLLNDYFGYHEQDAGVIIVRKSGSINVYDFNMQRLTTLTGEDATTVFDGTLHIGENMVAPPLAGNNRMKGKVYECKVYNKALSTAYFERKYPNIYSNENRIKGMARFLVQNPANNVQLVRKMMLELNVDMGDHNSPEYTGKYPNAVGVKVENLNKVYWLGTGTDGHLKVWLDGQQTLHPFDQVAVDVVNSGLCKGLTATVKRLRTVLLTEEQDLVKATDMTIEWDGDTSEIAIGQTLTGRITWLPDGANTDTTLWVRTSGSAVNVQYSNGTFTAQGKQAGTTAVTCTMLNGETRSFDLTVPGKTDIPVESVALNKTALQLTENSQEILTATVTPEDATDKTVTWSVNPEGVVSLSAASGESVTVTAVKAGDASISATAGEQSASCSVTVESEPVEPVEEDVPGETPVYKLAQAKTFVPANQECIDTGIKMFETIDPKPNWTILFDAKLGEDADSASNTYVLMHCMEETEPWPGFVVHIVGDGALQTNIYGGKETLELASITKNRGKFAVRLSGTTASRWQPDNTKADFTISDYNTAVDKSLLLGCYQQSDGTKGRFFDGTLYQCLVYNKALTDDQISAWMAK